MPGPRSFSDRAGVHIEGTIVSCDAGRGRDLTILSHAEVARPSSRRVVATSTTLDLMGRAALRLRPTALVVDYGRPFAVGAVRIELHPSGYLPGAASARIEVAGGAVVHGGSMRPGSGWLGCAPREVRPARALCVDARLARQGWSFREREAGLADVVTWVAARLGEGRTPVVLLPRLLGPDVAAALAAAGHALAGHRLLVERVAAYRRLGLAVPAVGRFAGRLAPGAVLLWPDNLRDAPSLGRLTAPAWLLAAPQAADAGALASARVDGGVALATGSDLADLLAVARDTGAVEVAVRGAPSDDAVVALRAAGHDAYTLGPPSQMALPVAADG